MTLLKLPLTRNQSALLVERRRVSRNGQSTGAWEAKASCPYCGGRALTRMGHDVVNEVPVCLPKKGLLQW